MKISVKVIPGSSQQKVVQLSETDFRVYVNVPPVKGEANKQARDLLCRFFNLPRHQVILVSGKTAKIKTFEVRG